MKPQPALVLAVLALGTTPLFATSARLTSTETANRQQIDVIAVAERFIPLKPPAVRPVSALVIDAGYAELGYPTKGEIPPSQKFIASCFSDVLTTQGFQPATSDSPASVVLVYHWGSVRPNPFYPGAYNVAGGPLNPKADPTWEYRLRLVAPAWLASRAMELLIEGHTNPLPGAYEPAEINDVVDHARYPRYFAVVSAYDAVSVAKGHPAPLWRTKLSAETTTGGTAEVLASLLAATGPFLDRDNPKPVLATVALASPDSSSAFVPAMATPSATPPLLRILLQYDHDKLFGSELPGPDSRYAHSQVPSSSSSPGFVDTLARRAEQLGTPSGLASFPNRR